MDSLFVLHTVDVIQAYTVTECDAELQEPIGLRILIVLILFFHVGSTLRGSDNFTLPPQVSYHHETGQTPILFLPFSFNLLKYHLKLFAGLLFGTFHWNDFKIEDLLISSKSMLFISLLEKNINN